MLQRRSRFRRVQSGIDYDSYYHEQFLRGMPNLHAQMRRLLPDERKAPLEDCNISPDFYYMPVCGGGRHPHVIKRAFFRDTPPRVLIDDFDFQLKVVI
mmetsp:Transcript_25324/g.52260  ORF Transcript_25324/g.52260 Transcript_25324/m.52260 type:complete len:98 (+) Transcript_25324:3-296(+)